MKLPLFILLPIVFVLSSIASIVFAVEQPQIYELSFWTKENVERDDRIVKISHHPCGVVAIAKVTQIPSLETDPTLEPERVVEFDSEGTLLRKWATPVDSTPIGIRDDRLLIEIYRNIPNTPNLLWIGLDGSITPETSEIDTNEPSQTHCDGLGKEFGDSGYANCWLYRDLANNKPRVLGFEGICT
jgi:hypothetical protein